MVFDWLRGKEVKDGLLVENCHKTDEGGDSMRLRDERREPLQGTVVGWNSTELESDKEKEGEPINSTGKSTPSEKLPPPNNKERENGD